MGISEGYKRIVEQRKAEWAEFRKRFSEARLPGPKSRDFDGNRPTTATGWNSYRNLLDVEGKLDEASLREIQSGLDLLKINEREERIRSRLSVGGSIPDPTYPDTSDRIPSEIALTSEARSIIHWAAIKELGLDRSGEYNYFLEQAKLDLYQIKKARGDFDDFYKLIGIIKPPPPKPSSKEIQTPQVPEGFVETSLVVSVNDLKGPTGHVRFIRYHLKYGLVQGFMTRESYFDRGAGGGPGAPGRRVTEIRPVVIAFLERVNGRGLRHLTKESIWRLTSDSNLIIGRNKTIDALTNDICGDIVFSTQKMLEQYFNGNVESQFIAQSLPVKVTKKGDSYLLRFFARPLIEAP